MKAENVKNNIKKTNKKLTKAIPYDIFYTPIVKENKLFAQEIVHAKKLDTFSDY